MSQAPRDLQPKTISVESVLEWQAKRLDKKVEDLTKEEREAAFAPLDDPLDMYRD